MKSVYKIVCRDKEITEFYIGSSMNFHKRKIQHKNSSNNLNSRNYCLPLYMFINVNGGFENWEIVVIKEYKFITKKELNINEQYYKDLLKPHLNDRHAKGWDIERHKKINNIHNKNKDNCPFCCKEYYSNNKRTIKLSNKLYKLNNSDKVKENNKIYRSKYNKIKDNCPQCGEEMLKSSITRHIKRKHKVDLK